MVFLELMVEEDSKVPKAKMVEMVSLAWDSREWRACPESEVDPGDPEEAEILVIQVSFWKGEDKGMASNKRWKVQTDEYS